MVIPRNYTFYVEKRKGYCEMKQHIDWDGPWMKIANSEIGYDIQLLEIFWLLITDFLVLS